MNYGFRRLRKSPKSSQAGAEQTGRRPSDALRDRKAHTFKFVDDGLVPNNPWRGQC
jgi:hypothetical protein